MSFHKIVTPAQAGVQFESAWIPACAGMTKGILINYTTNF